jgi:hypothetical protein
MKKLFLFALAISLTFTSCKKDALDVNFTTNISATSPQIDVNTAPINGASRMSSSATFSQSFVVDLSNPDTQDYLNKLKEISLSDVRLQFSGLSDLVSNNVDTDLTVTIDNQITFHYGNFKYSQVANGQDFDLVDSQKNAEIAEILLNRKKITVKIDGTIPDTATYHFFIKFLAKANIKAEAL